MGEHFEKEYLMTMGADFSTRAVDLVDNNNNKTTIIYQIWDLAGQPRFNAIRALYYSGTMGAAIEGGINKIKSIGFSLLDYSRDAPVCSEGSPGL